MNRLRLGVLGPFCALIAFGGCITRPATSQPPTTKSIVQIPLTETKISKVDLLFAIDNSASMGDKEALLRDAVPDLIRRLVAPLCIDPENPDTVFGPSDKGACPKGELEFSPITDLHVGIVSSSLGGVGSGSCPADYADPSFPSATWHMDDRGHLIARASKSSVQGDASFGFLAWKPDGTGDAERLVSDFQDLVVGVGEYGCGFEAQEESWYRFLIQPDPYATIDTSTGPASFVGVDEEILRQRHDFLRPDSLVAILQITDENESTLDPRSLGGHGFSLENPVPGTAPRATAACASNPNDPACTSCGFDPHPDGPECQPRVLSPEDDDPNVRFFHMKQRFGLDPMYPASRYTRGLGVDPTKKSASLYVPNRDGEHPTKGSNYEGRAACRNPLFAKSLPSSAGDELCNLEPGPRGPGLVFYAAITGVPGDLIPSDGVLDDAGWTRVLGNDPLAYDFRNADPRMLESITPRPGVSSDRDTRGKDLQYACTFDLATPRTCAAADPACDCKGAPGPLCDTANPHVQVRAKAYPGIRHIALAKSLGKNAAVQSICPEDTKDPSPGNARYGYRPAMRAIADRLGALISAQCLPRPPKADPSGMAPCLVLEAMTGESGGDDGCDRPEQGLHRADPATLRAFRDQQIAQGNDLSKVPLCEKVQLTAIPGTQCLDDSRAGWCYAQGDEALRATKHQCPEAIVFSPTGQPQSGHTAYLQCIEE
jgi:hypothetical protein